ncbi:hypothetical protein EKN38_25140 [Enterobacter sp. WCHEn045836]|uniref:hypothetical protein n=1 Tax=Enterobacter sp. WCHEn045836 TaxID=2497434 RepID=UPI000F840D3F|nr:hypothetical protein [Enterobacter sp. WCHEn045836]RTP93718.1 hypothetical protein EKN38_25140 [Enterobacter sp. WCHEn045836]
MTRRALIALMIILTTAAFRLQAAIVEGGFSDWYYVGSGTVALDYHFTKVEVVRGDPIVGSGTIDCTTTFPCRIRLEAVDIGIIALDTLYLSDSAMKIDDYNALVRSKLPWTGIGKIKRGAGGSIPCIRMVLLGNRSQNVVESCKGIGPPIPPVPSVPVTCTVDGLSNGVVDFGTISAVESPRKSIAASLSCTGDEDAEGSALLKLVGMDAAQENYAILHDSAGSEQIKVHLSVGNTGSNSEMVTVKSGWNGSRSLNFDINNSELTGKAGSFTGSAVLSFTVQ